MGEKGIPLQGSSMDALMQLAASTRSPRGGDPVGLLSGWSLQTIQDAVRDTPELANKWMEAYLTWREAQEQRGQARPPGSPPPSPPMTPGPGRMPG
jgi:hypothetical protein